MPTLYVVATPIGNLEDVTHRALRVLREVSLIAAEDTRTTRKLLARHGIRALPTGRQARLVSYNEHNRAARTPQILAALRKFVDAKYDVFVIPDPPVNSKPNVGRDAFGEVVDVQDEIFGVAVAVEILSALVGFLDSETNLTA